MTVSKLHLQGFIKEGKSIKAERANIQRELISLYKEHGVSNIDGFFRLRRNETFGIKILKKIDDNRMRYDNFLIRSRHLHLAYSLAKKVGFTKAAGYFTLCEEHGECLEFLEQFNFETNAKTKPNVEHIEFFFETMLDDQNNIKKHKRSTK
jgi:hypothetical protein